jgi:hypothetical protein
MDVQGIALSITSSIAGGTTFLLTEIQIPECRDAGGIGLDANAQLL